MQTILVVNAGSSSVKFQIFGIEQATELKQLIKGQMDGIGVRPRLRASGANGDPLIDQTYTAGDVPDVATAMRTAGAWLRDTQKRSAL
jgi:acetate kinase